MNKVYPEYPVGGNADNYYTPGTYTWIRFNLTEIPSIEEEFHERISKAIENYPFRLKQKIDWMNVRIFASIKNTDDKIIGFSSVIEEVLSYTNLRCNEDYWILVYYK